MSIRKVFRAVVILFISAMVIMSLVFMTAPYVRPNKTVSINTINEFSANNTVFDSTGYDNTSYENYLDLIDYGNDIDSAVQTAGFSFNLPPMSNYEIKAMYGLINIIVQNGDADTITYSKSYDYKLSDLSDCKYRSVNDTTAKKYDSRIGINTNDNQIYTITWQCSDYSYSVVSTKAITQKQALEIQKEVLDNNSAF